ncbi:GerAB/ArcD/ProY family transporter [Clostridium thailandense]|uniref:GerAB/ArcD/ProY family transporter n=1 Tax=Clostridium thailandense TaxID=2794346 RepID=UPI0039890331
MYKEQINDKEGICLLMIFIMGSTLIVGIGGEAKNDAWIAGILAILMAVPIILVYGRILSLFPGKDLYEILNIVLGRIISKIVAVIYIWYSFHLGALVIRNFGEFINTVTMPETPMIVPMICLGLVCIIATKSGIEVMGRISASVLPILLITILIVQLLAIPITNFSFLKPVLGNGFKTILGGAFSAFSFPFAETVLFIGILFSLKNQKSYYKVYSLGLFSAGIIIVILTMRNIVLLGELSGKVYFPSHMAVGMIKIGEFIERIEVSVSILFVFGVFIKTSVCLLVACKGISNIFHLNDYRPIVMQTGLLMVYFSYIVYNNTMEMRFWAFKVYDHYAFTFQVIIPILLLLTAEIKKRSRK